MVERTSQNRRKEPEGFIAFLIFYWGANEISIYENYYQRRLEQYLRIESKKAGAFKRDLKQEFYNIHAKQEKENLLKFINNFDYLPKPEKQQIVEFADYYHEYIQRYNQSIVDFPGLSAIQPQGKPVFKPEIIDTVFSLQKDYFAPEEQNELLLILKTGGTANAKLLFNDNGNRLADSFRQLFESGYIVGCQKQLFGANKRGCMLTHLELSVCFLICTKKFYPEVITDILWIDKEQFKQVVQSLEDKIKSYGYKLPASYVEMQPTILEYRNTGL